MSKTTAKPTTLADGPAALVMGEKIVYSPLHIETRTVAAIHRAGAENIDLAGGSRIRRSESVIGKYGKAQADYDVMVNRRSAAVRAVADLYSAMAAGPVVDLSSHDLSAIRLALEEIRALMGAL